MKTVLTTLLLLLLLQLCFAQNNTSTAHFNLLSIKDGMPEGTVIDLLQDKAGYIWVATQKGLVRYDGYTTRVYDFGIEDPNARVVRKIFEDGKEQLWAAVMEALYKYDRANDRFIPYLFQKKGFIAPLAEDKTGNLWLITGDVSGTTQSLMLLDPATKKNVLFGMDEKGKYHLNVKRDPQVFKDKQQQIWIGSGNGLYEYHPGDSTFISHFDVADSTKQLGITHIQEDAAQPGILYFAVSYSNTDKAEGLGRYNTHTGSSTIFHHDTKDANSIGSDTVWQVQNDSKGRLWILTAGGLSLFNPITQTFTNYAAGSFKNYPGTEYHPLNEYAIKEDKQGNLWCNSMAGLVCFNIITKEFTQYTANPKSQTGLTENDVYNLMMDRSGILWFGIAQEGLQWMDTKHHRFKKYNNGSEAAHVFKGGHVNSFAKANDGSIWLGTEHGLYRWLPQQDSFQFVKFDPYTNENTLVKRICCDSKELIWFSTYNFSPYNDAAGHKGLYCFNFVTGKLINYRYRQNDTTSLISDAVSYIYEDHLGDIWIGTDGAGICRFNRHTQSFTRFPFRKHFTNPDIHGALDDGQVQCIYEDKEGTLWVGTNIGGLNRFDRQKGTFISYAGKLPGFRDVITINEDSKGKLWAGTAWGGLFELAKNRDSIKVFTEKDGLSYDGATATAEDSTGNIWINSPRSISILNPENGQVHTIADISDLYMYIHAIVQTNTGDLLISTNDGFIALNPNDYALDTNAPIVNIEKIHLTEFVNNKPKDSAIMIDGANPYKFKYNENRVGFQYVGLYYEDATGTQYAYKLDGYDKDWIQAGTQRSVTYTNLAPNTYIFHVKAANSDGVWSKDVSIPFTITPPWWKTWWAYGLYVVVLVAAIWLFVAYRSRQLKQANRILEEKVTDRTTQLKQSLEDLKATQAQLIQSEKMASLGELTAGIAHEIQNPLNFVNNFSEVNRELIAEMKEEINKGNIDGIKLLTNDLDENEEKIILHGKRADSIVKGMLQHSRASSGQKELTDINKLADEYLRLSYHGMRAKDKSFNADFKIDFDENIGKTSVVPQDIGRVLLNLYNNAFYAVSKPSDSLKGAQYKPLVSVTTKKINSPSGFGGIEIKVSDNGSGIPQTIVDKIFQPFFTTKPTGQGTGLGLSLAYDIVKAHGGEIKVNTKEGEGSEFVIQLPA
jgi:signal transduction histidine kinase/ligand-binding sensor domain-containing protein